MQCYHFLFLISLLIVAVHSQHLRSSSVKAPEANATPERLLQNSDPTKTNNKGGNGQVCPEMNPDVFCMALYEPVKCGGVGNSCQYGNSCEAAASGWNLKHCEPVPF
jgi:hypothetical protein